MDGGKFYKEDKYMKKSKNIKLKDLLKENSFCIGTYGLGVPAKKMDWCGKTIKEDHDEDDNNKKKLLFGQDTDNEEEITDEMKHAFYEAVGNFTEYGKAIYRERNLKEVCETILGIGRMAERLALEETDDWFDTMSVQRDMKSLNESVKLFEKTAKDISILQQRLESVFEDIGQKIGRYYEIKQITENKKPVTKKKNIKK